MMAPTEVSPARRYRLIAEIGRGGMAEVYLAVSQGPGGFNKLVVVKKALRDLALQPEILSMFVDEARLAARMNHPNVVQTYELGEEEGRHFIAMEYLDGQPYSRVLARTRNQGAAAGPMAPAPMALGHHLRVLADTLSGLHHAHELRDFDGSPLFVVHRDVSPQNVFITYDGSIKVVDFGIAKAQDSSSKTVTGEIKGKVTYMSPEQMRGEPLDRRADVFAVGVMLWEAVAGRRMWKDLPDVRVVDELLKGRVPSIHDVAPQVPPALAEILARALHPDREGRYPSALAMQRDLEAFAASSGLRVDGAEVGELVSAWFEPERRRVRAVVEAQLGSLRWTGENPAASSLPVIPSASGSLTGRDWPTHDERRGDLASGVAHVSQLPTHGGASVPLHVAQPAQPRPRLGPVLAVAAASLAGIALAVVVLRAPRPDVGAHASAEVGAGTPSGALAPQAESVLLKVRTTPPEAKIYLDGILLGAGSFEGKVVRGDGLRALRVEAEGYRPEEEHVRLSADLVTSFSLDKLETTGAPSASAPIGRPLPPPVRPTGRGIDDQSPYGAP